MAVALSERLASQEVRSLLAHQRRWLTDLQVAIRAAGSAVDTLAAWWRSPELARLETLIAQVDAEVQWFAARHGAPRLAIDWSPITEEGPWARRYDELVGAGLADRASGDRNGHEATRDIITALMRADLEHPEIALLVSQLVGWLAEVSPTPA